MAEEGKGVLVGSLEEGKGVLVGSLEDDLCPLVCLKFGLLWKSHITLRSRPGPRRRVAPERENGSEPFANLL